MKKTYQVLCTAVVSLFALCGSSCISAIQKGLYGDIGEKIYADMPNDLSNIEYCDYKIEKYKFPDGKVADVYIFDEIHDQALWLNLQKDRFDSTWRKYYQTQLDSAKQSTDDAIVNGIVSLLAGTKQSKSRKIEEANWYLNVTGPMTPFYKHYTKLLEQHGGQKELLKMAEAQKELFVSSFYKTEELGLLGILMSDNSSASACYEDSTGVYWIRVSSPASMVSLRGQKNEQERHKGEIGIDVVYIPRTMYPKITPPKLKPAKVTPVNPNSIPDSSRNLTPVNSTGNNAYYYDADLAAQLQWIAVKVACKGTYDMAYTGNFRAKNPTDYYKTSFIKRYLASNDGQASKGTTLFEGICFDYADFAYQELSANKKNYSSRISNFYMVGTFNDSNDIITYRLAKAGEASNMIINRTPVVFFGHNHVKAHGNATNHAWFWVTMKDGTVYWVDPTWTDGEGYPVYGIVRGGQEMQLPVDQSLCIR